MSIRWLIGAGLLLASLPASTNYQLHNYTFGSGGTASSSSTNYRVNGTAGEQAGGTTASSNYQALTGNNGSQQANTPALTLSNPASYYNKLKFVLDPQSNPSDTKFAIEISTDSSFATTSYIKSDDSIGGSLALTDYQTFTTWGGAGGALVVGLAPGTTYYARAKAMQGSFTETGYGPSSSAATENPHLSFSINPSAISFGSLLADTVTSATSTIDLTFATNGDYGGQIFIKSDNAGLTASTTIPSASGDLISLSHGYGAQVAASAGGLSSLSPYNVSGNNVGIVDTTPRQILTATAPVTSGTGGIQMKAKAAITDPPSPNYSDTLTLIASASF